MTEYLITPSQPTDAAAILGLYRAVAAIEGGLARTAAEITPAYVEAFLHHAHSGGLSLLARATTTEQVLGEIHTYALGPQVFAHVLGELTIAVHPDAQGAGIGKALFTELLRRIERDRPDILRVELIARESNQKAIQFYQKLGFEIEGKFSGRIRSTHGGFEADIPMAWHRKDSATNDQ
ncbi:MAG: N-acetyltransferase [Blastocatellia bacterium]